MAFPRSPAQGEKQNCWPKKLFKSLKDDELLLGDPLAEYQAALNELAETCQKAEALATLPASDLTLAEKPAPGNA